MFAVIYRFKLKPEQEANYQRNWKIVANYFKQFCGALGSCLHKGDDQLWVAYSRWPDKATRDAAWPGEKEADENFSLEVKNAIKEMQQLKAINQDLEQYPDICMEVVEDLIVTH